MAERIFLIDGTAFAFRSFFAIRGLTNSKGRPTNAVFGFARVLLRIIREHTPSHICVVFDAPGKTFRDDLYPAYKANRQETPEDLISQFPVMREVAEAFNLPVIVEPGVEADDVIGTLSRQAAEQGMDAVIVTSDKDVLQLVGVKVKAYDPNKGDNGEWYGIPEVKERFGCTPERVVDALALMGDTADNVPGVKGIGPKTVKALMETYGSIENLYAHIGDLKGKQRENLEAGQSQLALSRQLVTIKTDVALPFGVQDCRMREFDRPRLADLFHELEFQSLLEEFLPDSADVEETHYTLVLTRAELERVIAEMRTSGRFAVDTETTGTDPMQARLVGVSLSCRAGTGYYIPISHSEESYESLFQDGSPAAALPGEESLSLLRPLLEDATLEKVGQNIKYDLVVLARSGVALQGIGLDTMVASYLTDPSRMRHNLDEISLHYLKRKMIPLSDLIGKGSKTVTFDKVPVDRACAYAAEDADITWRLSELFQPLLAERGLDALYRDVERPLIGLLARMEMAGIAIDHAVFEELKNEVSERLGVLEREIHAAAGGPFQINSPKQLQEVLFNKLKLKPVRKTKTGYSTDVEVLEELARDHPLPEKLLEYRVLEKLRGTYLEALPKLVHPETGRIHTSFNQAVAATGRLSSSDPNLQNIPIRTELGRRMRRGFVPGGRDLMFVAADYSQIELRILAHLSGDAALQEAFAQDADIHTDTAARVFGVFPAMVTPDMRRQAKAVNFGVIYGISPFGLSRSLGISTGEAGHFIENYFRQYPGVRMWIDETLEKARKDGFVTTLLNRRRYIPEMNSSNMGERKAAERVAMNTPVQGSAADIIKLAMLRLDAALRGTSARLLLQVHDELLVECRAEEASQTMETMRVVMESAAELSTPLKVDAAIGDNWEAIH
ncbi:MAG: DNA polymerase I [Candidatus Hydrogenedentota bacterium]